MGIAAGAQSDPLGGVSTATSLGSPVGMGIGVLFVAGALIVLLAYYDVLNASRTDYDELQTTLFALLGPLLFALAVGIGFHGVLIYS